MHTVKIRKYIFADWLFAAFTNCYSVLYLNITQPTPWVATTWMTSSPISSIVASQRSSLGAIFRSTMESEASYEMSLSFYPSTEKATWANLAVFRSVGLQKMHLAFCYATCRIPHFDDGCDLIVVCKIFIMVELMSHTYPYFFCRTNKQHCTFTDP